MTPSLYRFRYTVWQKAGDGMVVLVVVFSLGMLVLGYLVMRQIDHFVDRGGIIDSPQGRAHRGVLVYGSVSIADKIQNAGIPCKVLTDLTFPDDYRYAALFALSESDPANLALLDAAKNTDSGIYVIVRCNAPELQDVYIHAGANHLIGAGESIGPLLAELIGE